MPTMEFATRRFSLVSKWSIEETLQRFVATIGRPDIKKFQSSLHMAKTSLEEQKVVRAVVGSSDLMEFIRFDAAPALNKDGAAQDSRAIRLLVGNPVNMREMVKAAPDAAAYVPATVLIDQRRSGVFLSYDLMESLVAPYGDARALRLARDLDTKVVALLETAASGSDDVARVQPDDPIALAGSLAAADVLLMGAFFGDW